MKKKLIKGIWEVTKKLQNRLKINRWQKLYERESLGIIPLVIFCVNSNSLKELNGILFGMAVMGMISVYPNI